jgi:sn-glycerol 3-phosphate transport system substrate-binding protein
MRYGKRITAIAVAGLVATAGLVGVPAGAAVHRAKLPKCPLSALDKAKGTVEITMWESMTGANEETLQGLADTFNSSQDKVHVSLVNTISYNETINKYIAGLSTGDLPDLAQIGDGDTQTMIDTQSVLPAQSCVKAAKFDLSGHLERVIDYYTVEKVLWSMPFNVSGPVLYFDQNAFTAAGLDPNTPPTTLDEVMDASQKIVDEGVATAGYGLKLEPGVLEQWMSKAGKPYVDNDNGRSGRANKTLFNNKTGLEIFTWMKEMVDKGLATTNGDEGATSYDNLLGIGNGTHAMTTETSASLGVITDYLSSGQYPNVKLGVAPMPGPKGKGGVNIDGASLWVVNKSAPEKQAAAWEFAKFLNSEEAQATWAAATGYLPIIEAAAESPQVQAVWAEIPGYKVAYDQLLTGPSNIATAGPVIGDYTGVQNAVREAWQRMLSGGTAKAALKEAAKNADAAMQEYNSRVGG